jgi:TatD DNase family protein
MFVDSHCHLDDRRFDEDRASTLARAREAGVGRFVTIGCDEENSRRALGLAATHPDIWASVGVHPHEAAKVSERFVEVIEELTRHPRCVAVGECGLDYYYDNSPRAEQREVFAAQIALARRVNKPLVVHVRDAWEDCLEILEREGASECGGVIHCFSGEAEHAKKSLELGFYISIPGIVTFKKPGDLPEVVQQTPLERLLIETDSPYLAPLPFRGKRNEPGYVVEVAKKIAELRGAELGEISRATSENAARLFGLPV